MRRWYTRGKSIYQGGEEEDGRDELTRAICDPGRPPSRTNEAPSVRLISQERSAFFYGEHTWKTYRNRPTRSIGSILWKAIDQRSQYARSLSGPCSDPIIRIRTCSRSTGIALPDDSTSSSCITPPHLP